MTGNLRLFVEGAAMERCWAQSVTGGANCVRGAQHRDAAGAGIPKHNGNKINCGG